MQKEVHGISDIGKVRKTNEDFFSVDINKQLYILADGMGGHKNGEIASKAAIESINNYLTLSLISEICGNDKKIQNKMTRAVKKAHENVIQLASSDENYKGMGCTIIVALIDSNCLHLCHVGDSRVYKSNNSGIHLLTTDHSVVMNLVVAGKMTMDEARVSPLKNQLYQAIGYIGHEPVPDYNKYPINDNDKFLLCSDGCWDQLSNDQLFELLQKKKSAKTICQNLIKQSNQAGGNDNITVIVIQ